MQWHFDTWLFEPGMGFGDTHTWWPPYAIRASGHEGVDFQCFKDKTGRVISLNKGMKVPVISAGIVRQIFSDFLGQSVLISHNLQGRDGVLHSIYAHIQPVSDLRLGDHLATGQVIGSIKIGTRKVPAHLHLSYLWFANSYHKSLNWQLIQGDRDIIFTDPLDFID